ncbi:MAG: hypothetical protein K9G62_06515 [Alphaproteobacteria bacterium]|nr:hypothetical protein [Alphaproteobacteria bacterium]
MAGSTTHLEITYGIPENADLIAKKRHHEEAAVRGIKGKFLMEADVRYKDGAFHVDADLGLEEKSKKGALKNFLQGKFPGFRVDKMPGKENKFVFNARSP